jgi:Domain of unknown function DUF488
MNDTAGRLRREVVSRDCRPGGPTRQRKTVPPTADELSDRLFSVGHSNHSWERFVGLLRGAGVTAVADVRSSPHSGRFPHYSRPVLERGLRAEGIAYVFLGDSLGGRPTVPDLFHPDGLVDYERVRRSPAFRDGLERLLTGAERYRVAMLCAEEDPLDCHRGLMVAPELMGRGVVCRHLRGDGSVEPHGDAEARLLALTGVADGVLDGLFAAAVSDEERRELLAEAYREQARRAAFRLPPWPGGEAV